MDGMALEPARSTAIAKPWGVSARHFGFEPSHGIDRVGEVVFRRRAGANGTTAELELKLVLTAEPAPVEVASDSGETGRSGQPRGGGSACYVIEAAPDAKIAHGLREQASREALKAAVADGTLPLHLRWLQVRPGDVIPIPPRTPHSIGPGVVMVTVRRVGAPCHRLYDFHRGWRLEVENALSIADLSPGPKLPTPVRHDAFRTLLVQSPDFVFERMDLTPATEWALEAAEETWILCIAGDCLIGDLALGAFAAAFTSGGSAPIRSGLPGAILLVAYAAEALRPGLVRRVDAEEPV